jgi:5-methylcytosine-specific restriction endonuclease McrA
MSTKDKEKIKLHQKRYRIKHKEQIRLSAKTYRRTHKEEIKLKNRIAYLRKKENIYLPIPPTIEPLIPIDIPTLWGNCKRCHRNNMYTTDHHIIPRSYGGGDNTSNLILLCNQCHDYVELRTDELLKNNKLISGDILKNMILHDSFP